MDRSPTDPPLPEQLTLFDEPQPAVDGAARRLLRLGAQIVEYRFARSRRQTIGISIDAHGLAVRAPLRAPWRDIEAFLREKERWILAKLDEWASAGHPRAVFGASGESLPLFGAAVMLDVAPGRASVAQAGDLLRITHPEPHRRAKVRKLLVDWLKARALAALTPRAAHYAALLGRGAPPVALSNARTQWGVCTDAGAIRLSWRLVHIAPALADYVVAHEVAHLVELNHSRRFWRLLETLYPEWHAARESIELAAASLPLL